MTGLQYTQDEKKIAPGADGKTRHNIKCFNCEDWGHFADKCLKSDQDEKNDDEKPMLQEDKETEQAAQEDGVQHYNGGGEDCSDGESFIISFQFFNRPTTPIEMKVR